MKTFIEFISDRPVVTPSSNLPMNQISGAAGVAPPTSSDPSGLGQENRHQHEIEKLTHIANKSLDELFEKLYEKSINGQPAMNMITAKISSLANQYGLDTAVIKTNLNYQNEPKSLPLQPMANG